MFVYKTTVRFYEIDYARIAFFGRVFEYAHAALEELLTSLFGHPGAIFEAHGFGMPLVHSEADYKAPMRLGDRLRVEVTVSRLSERSATFRYAIVGDDDGRPRAQVTLVHAFVSMIDFKPTAVPALFREALEGAGLVAMPLS